MKSIEEDIAEVGSWNDWDNFGDITGDEDVRAPSPVKAMVTTFIVLGVIIGLVVIGGK